MSYICSKFTAGGEKQKAGVSPLCFVKIELNFT